MNQEETKELTIDDIQEIKDIVLINQLTDLILLKNQNSDNLWCLTIFHDDSRHAVEEKVYYTEAENMEVAKNKLFTYLNKDDLHTLQKVTRVHLPVIPKVI